MVTTVSGLGRWFCNNVYDDFVLGVEEGIGTGDPAQVLVEDEPLWRKRSHRARDFNSCVGPNPRLGSENESKSVYS